MIERPFIVIASEGMEFIVSMLQIVRTSSLGSDQITLHMSDGSSLQLRGRAVSQVIARICEHAVYSDGVGVVEEAVRRAKESTAATPT